MARVLMLLLAVLLGVLSTACTLWAVRVELDGHSDKYIRFEIFRYDSVVEGKPVEGIVRWTVWMNSREHCNASDEYDRLHCGMGQASGTSESVKVAREVIWKDFERFKENNLLIVDPNRKK